ncbi:GIY-YIG nuclease family protein [Myroides marinus]|uniref:GIY-YIG nuclease family protein n=1 Tax=Myroides marinus TaxID=703342 RepID=UPI000B0A4425|nr:GIY-YIG nuclease family protein [Myroides marinus]
MTNHNYIRGFYYIYILTNKHRTTFYIGFTNDLPRRISEHINGIETNTKCFTARYNVTDLIYYESFLYVNNAIYREKELKGWRREKN